MKRTHWLVWSSLFALAGCASLLSLDDLKVEKVDGAAGTGGGLAGGAGAAGLSGGGGAGTGGGSGGTGGGGSAGAGAGGGGSAGASGAGAGGTGGGGAAGSAGQALAVPPPRPVGNPVPSGGKRLVFAVRNFWLGLSDPVTHAADPDAWRQYGFDFDGKCTTLDESKSDMSGVCRRVKGSPPQAHVDGDGCRDNNFGGIIVSAVALAQQDLESKLNNGLAKGGATMLLIIDDIDQGTADDPYAPGRLYVATDSTTVKWDGNDVREIDANTVFSGDLAKPKSEFKRGYIKNNTWVSGEHNDTPSSLIFPVSGEPVVLDATTLIVTLEFDAAREKVVHSDLGAVLNIEKFIAAVTPSLAKTAGCGSFSLYVDIISKTPDLFDARTSFSDPTMPCNALSLGGMLDWLPVKEPTKVISVPPLPDLCDGGI